MKRFLSALLLSALVAWSVSAQNSLYLFHEYTQGSIYLSGFTQPESVLMNIDALGQRILYLQGETVMELTNVGMVDSLKTQGRTFVFKEGLLCERMPLGEEMVFINWKFKKVNVGSVGALGAATQNKVDVLWTNLMAGDPVEGEGRYYQMGEYSRELWERKSDNTYFFTADGRSCRAKRLKDLYKAFPDKADLLKAYVKDQKLTMESAQDALKVIHYLIGLFPN